MAEQYSVSYGGFPVHLEEPSYELHFWLARALSIPGNDLFAGAPLGVSSPEAPWGCPIDSTLERTNWPNKDAPLLNSLQWPVTGATRFARSIWLFSGDDWDSIKADLDETDPCLTLAFFEGQSADWAGTREIEMYALRPRRVQPVDLGTPVLWIVPLVDVRYLWQFRPVELTCDKDTTWTDLLDQINNELRTSVIYRGSVSGFGNPDPKTWNGRVEPASVLLDAIAGSLGRRFVATTDGAYSIATAEISTSDSADWPIPENERPRLAGDDNDHSGFIYPEKLWTAFPSYQSGTPQNDPPHVIATSMEEWAAGTFWTDTGSAHLVRSTYYADIDPENPDDPPLNLTALQAISDEIGEAIAEWLALEYEYSFHGHAEHWVGCGFDDTITIEFGTLNPLVVETRLLPGNYRSRTHIKSLPPNCLPTTNYSQEPGKVLEECPGGEGGGGTLYGFRLDETLSYADADGIGSITEVWLGDTPTDVTRVPLLNPETHIPNSYIFAGVGGVAEVGYKGLCVLANPNQWIADEGGGSPVPSYTIIQMECSEDEGGESGKVKIDINGELRFLENQWDNLVLNTYDSDLHSLVYFENDQSDQLIAFVNRVDAGSDELVGVDINDTSPGYLTDKLGPFDNTPTSAITVYFKDEGTYVSSYVEEGDLPANTDEKVKINSGDTAGSEFLEEKFDNTDTYNPTTHQLVYFESLAETFRAFTDQPPEDRLVAADSLDSSPSTLDNKIANPDTYDSGAHQLVYQEVSGATIQLFTNKPEASADIYVKTTSSDPTTGYLDAKFAPGGTYGGSMIVVQWDQSTPSLMRGFIDPLDLPADSDEKVKVSGTDTAEYLDQQFTPSGSPVIDAMEVTFNFSGDVVSAWVDPAELPPDSDEKVMVTAEDISGPEYLSDKFPDSGVFNPTIHDLVYFATFTDTMRAFIAKPVNTDELVSVRSGDTPGYLEDQLSPIDAEIGGAIQVHFDSDGLLVTAWVDPGDIVTAEDKFVAVSSSDTPGYLQDQLTPLETPTGGEIEVKFSSTGNIISAWFDPSEISDSDQYVKVSASDTEASYLQNKLDIGAAGSTDIHFQSDGLKIYASVDIPGGTDENVKLRVGDDAEHLEDKFADITANSIDSKTDIPTKVYTSGSWLQIYATMDSVNGWSETVTKVLKIISGEVQWAVQDDIYAKVSATDPSDDYLEAKFDLDTARDTAVKFQSTGSKIYASVDIPIDPDEKVKVSIGDPTTGYLEDKVDIGAAGNTAVKFQSSGSKISASVDINDQDKLVAVTMFDTPDYLSEQFTPSGSPITGASTVTFNNTSYIMSAWTDSIVKTTSSDSSPGYLDTKFYPIESLPTGTGTLTVYFAAIGNSIQAKTDLKNISGYNGSAKQVLVNNNGSISWQNVVTRDVVTSVDFIAGVGFIYYEATLEVIGETGNPNYIPWESGGPCPPEGI